MSSSRAYLIDNYCSKSVPSGFIGLKVLVSVHYKWENYS